MTRLKKLLLSSFMMASLFASAQQISVSDAMSKARTYLNSNSTIRRTQGAAQTLTLAYTAKKGDEVQFYVFNKGNNQGFIIMGGDERANEVLGCSNSGSFDINTVPENVKSFLESYQEEIHYAIANDLQPETSAPAKARRAAAVQKVDVEALIKTKWNQTTPFNNALPTLSDGSKLYTGCSATAGAQVVNYWKYPTKGTGSLTYSMKPTKSDNTEGTEELTFSADYGNTTYEWSSMLNEYPHSYSWVNDVWTATPEYTVAQGNAVATLMYHIGVMAGMSYGAVGSGGSSGSIVDIAKNLPTYMGYSKTARFVQRNMYSDEEWETLMYNELKAGRPILYAGQSTTSGHAYVCHGYHASDNTFDINWGWGGSYDGQFALTGTGALCPKGTGAGGAAAGSAYDINQYAMIGVSPNAVEIVDPIVVGIKTPDGGRNIEVTQSSKVITTAKPDGYVYLTNMYLTNQYISQSFELCWGIKLSSASTGKTYYIESYSSTLNGGGYGSSLYGLIPSNKELPAGSYTLSPVYKLSGSTEWTDVKAMNGVVFPTLTIEEVIVPVAYCKKFAFNGSTASSLTTGYDSSFNVDLGFSASSSYEANTEMKVAFKFQNGDDVYYSSSSTFSFQGSGWGYSSYPFTVDPSCVLKNGTYTLIPVCKGVDDKDWLPMTMNSGVSSLTVTITGRSGSQPDPEPEVDNSVVHTDATIPSTSSLLSVTASEGTVGEGTQTVDKLFDSTPSTKWCKNFGKTWAEPEVIFNMGKKVYLTNYKLTEGADTHTYPNRNWSTWTVYGSNDKENWTQVSKESDAKTTLFRKTSDTADKQYSSIYAVGTTTTAYQYYKVVVNSVVGTESCGYVMQMADMYLYGKEYVEPLPTGEHVHVNATITAPQLTVSSQWSSFDTVTEKEKLPKLFDGQDDTKWCITGNNWPMTLQASDGSTVEYYPFVQIKLDKQVYLTNYSLTEAEDTYKYPNRNWSTWEVYGSNDWDDDDSWVRISNEDDPKETLFRLSTDKTATQYTSVYSINQTTPYQYYMFIVGDLVGAESSNFYVQQMAELKLYGSTSKNNGDIDGNGTIDTSDVTDLRKMILGSKTQSTGADVNNDGVVNILDLVKLIQMLKK